MSSLFLLCDIQTKFKPAIYQYNHVVATANKMVAIAQLFNIPVICTTQNAKGNIILFGSTMQLNAIFWQALGPIDPAIDLTPLGDLLLGTYDKTLFSMVTPEVEAVLDARPSIDTIVLFGIESHVCVLQTTLALLARRKYRVYVVTDGVSSCNSFEVPIALDRMRNEGAIISTSESVAFELMKDAGLPRFKAFSKLIKETKETTKRAGEALLQGNTTTPINDSDIASGGVQLKSVM